MMKYIIITFLTGFMTFNSFLHVQAENKLTAPFKSPFSIFSDKKETVPVEEDKETESDLNAKVEELKKTEKEKKPIKVFDAKNSLGITYAENVVNKAEFYIEENDFESAREAINSVSDWVYDATEYHTDLFKTLKKLENSQAQSNIERDLAIKFAVLRDKTLYLESKVFLEEGNKRQAVENLVEVVRSQPSTDLGFKAYEMLQEMGFTYKVEFGMVE